MSQYFGALCPEYFLKSIFCEGANVSNTDLEYELSPEEQEAAALKKEKNKKRKKRARVFDRIAGFVIATVIVLGCAGIGLLYVIEKGPSPQLCSHFVNTMDETRRFKFVPSIILSDDELAEIRKASVSDEIVSTDTSLINVGSTEVSTEDELKELGLYDEDGDGVVYIEINRGNYKGYMLAITDPTRVFIAIPDVVGGTGWTLEQFADKYNAIGGINAGGFKDDNGSGTGGLPQGLTIVDGHCYNDEFGVTEGSAGFDSEGILHVGYFTYEDCVQNDIVNVVSFGPILISNGVPTSSEYLTSGVNPRTAIGQRADGTVLLLVIDGRQVHSAGATYQDCQDIMLDYGAVNACNMDGGSSTAMYYNGEYVNSMSSANGQCRALPNAIMFK
jgi:exopolysaccharide biosynthesis protein